MLQHACCIVHYSLSNMFQECTWPFSVGLGVQSNSPLKPRVDNVINKIVESGLVQYWFDESLRIATKVLLHVAHS